MVHVKQTSGCVQVDKGAPFSLSSLIQWEAWITPQLVCVDLAKLVGS